MVDDELVGMAQIDVVLESQGVARRRQIAEADPNEGRLIAEAMAAAREAQQHAQEGAKKSGCLVM